MKCEESATTKQGVLATQPHDWNESRANRLARLEVLSCSATVGVTLQLPCMLHTCATFGDFLGFLSQNSLWKPFTIRGYKSIYSRVCMECEESATTKYGVLATQAHDWNELRV